MPFQPGKGTYFGLEPPTVETLLPSASGLCVQRIALCPHASGTHTECLLHIDPLIMADMTHTDAWKEGALVPCTVVRVKPVALGASGEQYTRSVPLPLADELVVTRAAIVQAVNAVHPHDDFMHSMLVLTEGVEAFFTHEAMHWLVEKKVTRLLVDQVTVDRAVCGPGMPAHRIFFGRRPWACITEMVRTPLSSEAPDGMYLLNLHLTAFLSTDAVPSRPVLYTLVERGTAAAAASSAAAMLPPLAPKSKRQRKSKA